MSRILSRGVSRPTPRGGEVEGSGLGGSPDPHPGGRLRGLAGGGSPGPHPGGKLRVWLGGSPGPHPGGCQGPGPRGDLSQHALGQTSPQQMATAVGSTHPTGMHSCFSNCYLR